MLEWMFVGTLGGLGAVVLMGLEALNCLLTCRGKRRTRLLYAAAGLGIVLLLWWGGDALLKMMGLAWRSWVRTAFGVAALVLGVAGAFLTVHWCGKAGRPPVASGGGGDRPADAVDLFGHHRSFTAGVQLCAGAGAGGAGADPGGGG